jgi:hypothetical protein
MKRGQLQFVTASATAFSYARVAGQHYLLAFVRADQVLVARVRRARGAEPVGAAG